MGADSGIAAPAGLRELRRRPTEDTQDSPTAAAAPPAEQVDWAVVSVDAEAFGIQPTTDDPAFAGLELHTDTAPLDQLIAFALVADGLSEGACEGLYQRFMEAPNTVLTYLSLMGQQTVERSGETVCAAEEICRSIAADVAWHDATEAFSATLETCRSYYPTGRIAQLLDILAEEHESSIRRNPPQ